MESPYAGIRKHKNSVSVDEKFIRFSFSDKEMLMVVTDGSDKINQGSLSGYSHSEISSELVQGTSGCNTNEIQRYVKEHTKFSENI